MPLFPGDGKAVSSKPQKGQGKSRSRGFFKSSAARSAKDQTGEASLVKSKEQRQQERKKRQREFYLAALGLVLVLLLMFVQLQYFRSVTVFFVLFFVNTVLILGILFVVLRNGVKLLLERRRRVIGSRLRTRLVLAISGMTLVPCLIMFLVTAQFVKISVDFWFETQVEGTVEAAMEIARHSYDSSSDRLYAMAEYSLEEVGRRGYEWGGSSMDAYLERKRAEYQLALMGFLDANLIERNWRTSGQLGDAWQRAKAEVNWDELDKSGFILVPGRTPDFDLVFGLAAVRNPEGGARGYLVLGETMAEDFWSKLDLVSAGTSQYKLVRNLKRELKATLYITLTVLTSLIALATVWFAFRVGRELTAPITALVGATERIAQGDTDVRIEDSSSDEFAVLVSSFNKMSEEIGQSRQDLTDTNDLLAQQNLVLDQQRRYVETVLDNIAAGVISFDAEWQVNTANQAACVFLGQVQEYIIGRPIMEFLPDSELRAAKKIGLRLLRRPGAHFQYQLSLPVQGEERRLLATAVGLPSPEGRFQGGVVVFEDITEMEKMQRTAAWREVARRIAHEIKNPLTPIKLSAQRLEKKFGTQVKDPAFRQSTQLIVSEVEQLLTMVQEFSAFAKLPEIRPRRSSIMPILEDVVNIFRDGHPTISWSLEPDPETGRLILPDVEVDAAAMHRAFLNILTNSVEAMEGQPEARVEIRASHEPDARLLRVDIVDNGPGLSADERKRVFEPYFTRKKTGTGLGLTIVRSVVTEHRGYVRAFSPESGGLGISVELPVA